MRSLLFICIIFFIPLFVFGDTNSDTFCIARLKYNGGGDWYNDPSMIPNMHDFLKANTTIDTGVDEARISIMDEELFSHPFIFLTGHGRIFFTQNEAERLRLYLTHGGFLYADDDYGMDSYFRKEMNKVFPDKKLVEIPFSHDIFHNHFVFDNGLPKIHEHDEGSPKAFGYFHEGRLVVFYSFNTNISDGWADKDVHNDPPDVREKAFRMGTNIIIYALTQ